MSSLRVLYIGCYGVKVIFRCKSIEAYCISHILPLVFKDKLPNLEKYSNMQMMKDRDTFISSSI